MIGTATRAGPLFTIARILGLGAALGTMILYSAFLVLFAAYNTAPADPSLPPEGLNIGAIVVGMGIILLALLAAWGALTGRPMLLFIAFVLSFFPVGLYMLGAPSIFAAIGICHLLYLVAGIVMLIQRRMV